MLPPDDRAESKKFDGGINMKKLLALLLAALMVFGMAACAKTAETPAADTPAGETTPRLTSPQNETTADETPAESDGDKVVIHYWAQWTENEAQAEVYKAAIARFEQAHPDCTVEVNWAGRDVREILRASIDSGNAIDIVDSGFDQIVNLLGEDYLMDLTSYMEGSDFRKGYLRRHGSVCKELRFRRHVLVLHPLSAVRRHHLLQQGDLCRGRHRRHAHHLV